MTNATVTKLPRTKKTAAKKTTSTRKQPTTIKSRRSLSIQSAIGTPILAVLLTSGASDLAHAGSYLAIPPALIAIAVLFVSGPHVRDGFQHVTGQSVGNATCMAIGIDAGMLCMEALLHLAPLSVFTTALFGLGLAGCLYLSVRYNVVAYTLHAK